MNKVVFITILCGLLFFSCGRDEHSVQTNSDLHEAVVKQIQENPLPVLGCWFWQEREFEPEGYKEIIDKVSLHSAYNFLTTSFRVNLKEVADKDFHDQLKRASEYALEKKVPLIADLDVRLARRAFERKYPDELQEMLILQEVELKEKDPVVATVYSKDLNDHYTHRTTHYISLKGSLQRIYSYAMTDEGIDKATLEDITEQCHISFLSKDSVQISIPAGKDETREHACVMVSFTHLTPAVFSPNLPLFQRELLEQYADVPLAGACKDEWGFPPSFAPKTNEFWYSTYRSNAYAERTKGRDLLADCLLMYRGIKGQEQERILAINHFMEMSWQRNSALEDDFYRAVKEIFGPEAIVATHPTWFPYPDAREYTKNGLDWWAVTRDLAQTDELTPFAVRTALAKKWKSPTWYNMFYAKNREAYERSVWSFALAGGRVNYHRIYPSEQTEKGKNDRLELLRGDLMRAESRVRLLNYISKSPLNSPVAVVFGHARTMNWAGPAYDDVGMGLVDSLWGRGIATDLIPTSEIENGSLLIDENGAIRYGDQQYSAVILYYPEYERAPVSEFFKKASAGPSRLFRMGHWTRDFDGNPLTGNDPLPASMTSYADAHLLLADIEKLLKDKGIEMQTPASDTLSGFLHTSLAPPMSGFCRLIDGTYIIVAGTHVVSGDPIMTTVNVDGYEVVFDAVGVAAVRLDKKGRVEALACGGLKSFKAGEFVVTLAERVDVALWINDKGQWEGVLQGLEGDIPEALSSITNQWKRLEVPVPLLD